MALEPTILDDLTWIALVENARSRIPAASDGRWTLHAPVDPGITIIELHAWLLEQRSFWMDQEDGATLRGLLALLGESVLGPRASRTVLRLRTGDPAAAGSVRVPADTPFVRGETDEARTFTTRDPLLFLPVERVGIVVNDVDRTADLRQGRVVPLLQSADGPATARVVLWLRNAPPPSADMRAAVLIDLVSPVHPEWTHDAVDVPAPAPVRWTYSRGVGRPDGDLTTERVQDGTGGLRRAGLLRFDVPSDWAAGDPGPDGLLPYTIALAAETRRHSAPPQLRGVEVNVASAHHERPVQVQTSPQWLPVPGAVFDLEADPPLPATVKVTMTEPDGVEGTWQAVETLAFSGPGDRVFEVDRERRRVRFGDGLTGRIPRVSPAQPVVRAQYRAGGGAAGDMGAGGEWQDAASLDLLAANVVEASGGRDGETFDDARARIQQLFRRPTRAVTAADYRSIAVGTPGVTIARAHAAIGFHPGFRCDTLPGVVTVFVVPRVPRAVDDIDLDDPVFVADPQPDAAALAAVRETLDRARLVGTELYVCGPRYRDVTLTVALAAATSSSNDLRTRIVGRLHTFLDPLAGGEERRGWTFGDPLRPSSLVREAQRAAGDDGEVVSVGIGLDGLEASDSCSEQAIQPYELPVVRRVAVRFAAARQTTGGLR